MRPQARRTDPSTSHAAAASVGDLTENQMAIMTVFRLAGSRLLDEQLISLYKHYQKPFRLPDQSESGIRTRRCELSKAEKLVEAGRIKMSTGRMGRTWRIA